MPTDAVTATLTASESLVGVITRSVSDILDLISLPQYRAMVILAPGPLLRVELIGHLGSNQRRSDELLGSLLDGGWADLEDDGTVRLSAHGAQLVAHVESRRASELSEILESLPRADRRTVATGFTIFASAAESHQDNQS